MATQFDKVFAINLASRTDKRDNIVLGSSVTGFVVDLVDGVDPEGMNPKSYPYVSLEQVIKFYTSVADQVVELEL